jgi:BirA family transcriptional regulator, biotin operon repressor / biotin---[acetyl-CoA-carboxylase] ligase
VTPPPDLAAAVHAAQARTRTMTFDVRWQPSVTSTMDMAADAVQSGGAEGLVFIADEQTAGRGRRGRSWSSPAGAGLYLSIVLRPAADSVVTNRVRSLITLAAGVAVREAIARASGLYCDLKWPNDVVIERRKVAGILAEGFFIGSADQAVVLGVGINVLPAPYPPDVMGRAIALENELGKTVDRAVLFEESLIALATWYGRLRRGDADGILRAWRDAAPSATGARVEWADGERRGVTAGVDDEGALLIATADGLERIVSGELRWL